MSSNNSNMFGNMSLQYDVYKKQLIASFKNINGIVIFIILTIIIIYLPTYLIVVINNFFNNQTYYMF